MNTDNVHLGHLIDRSREALKDAIHIAVFPAIAGEDLRPGERVCFSKEKGAIKPDGSFSIGIVDPFLAEPVKKGQRFWICLYPGTVSGMRHEWECPYLWDEWAASKPEDSQEIRDARRWLESFALRWNFDFQEMINEAQQNGGIIVAREIDLHGAGELAPGDEEKFWECIQILTGSQYNEEHRKTFVWSCSC